MTALSELTCLGLRRPRPQADADEVADYLEAMAHAHERLATETHESGEAVTERALAAAAHARATSLRTREVI
ncbi:hypothetical protein SAMN06265360_12635 [Haloechinothrix alba]|uniref:Uncharacterized protein n=1 Tax=Haloechinothrix alba TaxID=664784 RepID=A0A238ZXD3_9PSEU|nr:hypothetical protein [Haloechinothrix alba]SNR87444.1 hypothetical protein SAMN06265360_12635 [Haloechinothrix alba]